MMTKIIVIWLPYLAAAAAAFSPVAFPSRSSLQNQAEVVSLPRLNPLCASTAKETDARTGAGDQVPLIVEGKNLEVTESLYNYVDKKVRASLDKLSGGSVRECDVILSASRNPKVKNKHRVEVVTNVKGTTIICKHESPDMYASIDAAASALYRKLLKYKERRQDGWHGGAAMGDDIQAAIEALEAELAEQDVEAAAAEEEFVDPEAPSVTKINSFRLDKPISLQEAIFALDYVDHDFYVFRNEESGQINVVYKRHGGGIGLIES